VQKLLTSTIPSGPMFYVACCITVHSNHAMLCTALHGWNGDCLHVATMIVTRNCCRWSYQSIRFHTRSSTKHNL